jgi:hypothetical protein
MPRNRNMCSTRTPTGPAALQRNRKSAHTDSSQFFLHPRPPPPSYQASRDDLAVYAALAAKPDSKYPNAARWYSHISALLGAR